MTPVFDNVNDAVNTTFLLIVVISAVLLLGITAAMIWFVIRYNRKRHPVPAAVEGHTILEIVWTVIPTILVMGMFYYGYVGFKMMRHPPEDALEVKAIGQMWSWTYEYENGKKSPDFYVPVGNAIKVNLESRDVLHSFYLPAFMVKQDVVPGMETFVWFDAQEEGVFDIFCAEYCGQRHSYMLSKVHVVPQEEYDAWVAEGAQSAPEITEDMSEEERQAKLVAFGKQVSLAKGCNACHTVDGTALVGPTYKGLFGRTERVVTDGEVREIEIDEEYVRRSILHPNADIVEGYQPLMPSQEGLVSDEELEALIAYLKTL